MTATNATHGAYRRRRPSNDALERIARDAIPGHPDTVASHLDSLSAPERRVLTMRCCGFSNDASADRLYLATNTVKNHVTTIIKKFGGKRMAGICFELGRDIGRKERTA